MSPIILEGAIAIDSTSFLTVEELELATGQTYDTARAQFAIDLATGTIRAACKHRISYIASDSKKLHGTWGDRLLLPEPPVADVISVHVRTRGEDDPTETTGFTWTRHGHLLRGTDLEPGLGWGGSDAEITVVYSHGFDPVPDDIKALALQLTRRVYDGIGGVERESIGSYSVGYGSSSGVGLTEDEMRVCRRYWPIDEN